MGSSTLTPIGSGVTNAVGSQLDQILDALAVDLVPRNASYVATDLGGDLGTASYRFRRLNVQTAIIGGTTIDPSVLTSKNNRITAYAVDSNDFPSHLSAMGTNSLTVRLTCTTTAFQAIINGTTLVQSSNVNFTVTAGFSANNTALINEAAWTAASAFETQAKTFGEGSHESVIINFDTAGSNISGLTIGDKVFFRAVNSSALVEIVYGEMITVGASFTFRPIYRGVDTSGARQTFRDNDTWTIMRATWLFIDTAGTAYTTTVHPIEAEVLPSAGTSGRYIYRTGDQTWWYDDGATVTQVSRMPIGVGLSHNTTDCSYVAILPEWDMFKADYFNHKRSDVTLSVATDPTSTSKGLIISGSVKCGTKTFTYNNRRISTATSGDRESGTADISAIGGKYVYVSFSTGALVFSDVSPRKWAEGVLFHPAKMWRCILYLPHSATAFDRFSYRDGIVMLYGLTAITAALTTSQANYPMQSGYFPPWVKQMWLYCDFGRAGGIGGLYTVDNFTSTTDKYMGYADTNGSYMRGVLPMPNVFSGMVRMKIDATASTTMNLYIGGYEIA